MTYDTTNVHELHSNLPLSASVALVGAAQFSLFQFTMERRKFVLRILVAINSGVNSIVTSLRS
jgi:hypothetical protein